jgi:hypothetical protein
LQQWWKRESIGTLFGGYLLQMKTHCWIGREKGILQNNKAFPTSAATVEAAETLLYCCWWKPPICLYPWIYQHLAANSLWQSTQKNSFNKHGKRWDSPITLVELQRTTPCTPAWYATIVLCRDWLPNKSFHESWYKIH